MVEIAIDIAEGLSAAHARNIVHRDLKPANVMILEDGRVKIIDFGIAKLLETGSEAETATKTHTMLGTVAYMSPEQARSVEIDHRSDLFSFGIVLYEMLTGANPFGGPSAPETLSAIINASAPRLPSMLASIQPILDRCLAKDVDARYNHAREIATALRGTKLGETSRRSRAPWVVAAVAAVVVAAVLLSGDGSAPAGTPRIANPTLVTRAVGVEDHSA